MKTYFASIPFPFKHISINVVDRVSDYPLVLNVKRRKNT